MDDDSAAIERKWELTGKLGLVLFGGFALWMIFKGFPPEQTLNPAEFAGCYRGGDRIIRLAPDGSFVASQGKWAFRIIKATPGKHGELLAVDGIEVEPEEGGVRFVRRGVGYRWPIRKGVEFTLYAGAQRVTFAKVPCEVGSAGLA